MRPLILLVEDDPDDALFLQRAFDQLGLDCDFKRVEDGREALDHLEGLGLYGDRSRHPLATHMILDISIPKISGLDVLARIRSRPALRGFPVIILSGSAEPEDVDRAQALGIDAMLQKPLSIGELTEIARGIARRWGIAAKKYAT